jgi:non-homologous end joining protein Ku
MIIDKIEHQQILLELIKQANFPGNVVEIISELKKSIQEAEISS